MMLLNSWAARFTPVDGKRSVSRQPVHILYMMQQESESRRARKVHAMGRMRSCWAAYRAIDLLNSHWTVAQGSRKQT